MLTDVETARNLAPQVLDFRQPRTWRKVTTILSAFDVVRLTDGVRRRITDAFDSAGLQTEPSMMTVDRAFGMCR